MASVEAAFSSLIKDCARVELGTDSFLGAGGHTLGAGALVGVVMEAMRAERRHEVVADMDGSRQAGLVSIKVTRCFNFFITKEKRGNPVFLLFSSCVSSY